MAVYCGWDGGGTHTTVLVSGPDGQELARGAFGPLNLNGNPADTVADTIRQAVDFMNGHGACRGLVIGMAGISNWDAADFITRQVRVCGYEGPLRLVGDQ